MKHYLVESLTIDFSDKVLVKQRKDVYESLGNKKFITEGKEEFSVLNVYRLGISPIGELNKNGRMYDEQTWTPVLSQGMGNGAIGNLDHPKIGEQPSIKDGFGVWKNYKIERMPDGKKYVFADLYIADNLNGKH